MREFKIEALDAAKDFMSTGVDFRSRAFVNEGGQFTPAVSLESTADNAFSLKM